MRGSRAAEGDRDRPGSARSARSAGFILALPRGGRLASPLPTAPCVPDRPYCAARATAAGDLACFSHRTVPGTAPGAPWVPCQRFRKAWVTGSRRRGRPPPRCEVMKVGDRAAAEGAGGRKACGF